MDRTMSYFDSGYNDAYYGKDKRDWIVEDGDRKLYIKGQEAFYREFMEGDD